MEFIKLIQPIDLNKGQEVQTYIDTLTKPIGSLGRLEELAVSVSEMTGNAFPDVSPPGVIVFAADHGVTAEGVSAFPQDVTAQMVHNFLNKGAAMNVFSKQIGASFKLVDIGVASDIQNTELVHRKVRYGTANFYNENAMESGEAEEAIQTGYEEAKKMIDSGVKCLIPGDIGIGNTTSASAITAALSREKPANLVGNGTGITSKELLLKQQVVEHSLKERKPNPNDAIDVLMKVGGLEIAGITGAILAGAAHRIPVLIDGFICTAAAILAKQLSEDAVGYMILGHQSVEPGHKVSIEMLGKKPILDLGMRLGEGTGAAVAYPILLASINMLKEMATFEEANVSNKKQ